MRTIRTFTLLILAVLLSIGAFAQDNWLNRYSMEKPLIIYVGDPMCSWCYGFAPEISTVMDHYTDNAQFALIMGGLRPGTKEPMDAQLKEFLRHHWEEIGDRTGQPFKLDMLAPEVQFVYDTEPPARAVVALRKSNPDLTFQFFKDIQTAFYAKNANTHAVETYLDLLPKSVDKAQFEADFNSAEARAQTQDDYNMARNMGVSGFPSVLVRKGNQLYVVARGYSSSKELIKRIDKVLKQG